MQNLFAEYDLSKFEVQDRVQHEFQAIGLEMQEFFPKKEWRILWSLFWKHNPKDIEKAFEVCKKNGVCTSRYLIGVLKRI